MPHTVRGPNGYPDGGDLASSQHLQESTEDWLDDSLEDSSEDSSEDPSEDSSGDSSEDSVYSESCESDRNRRGRRRIGRRDISKIKKYLSKS